MAFKTPTTMIWNAHTAARANAAGWKVPGPCAGATHLGGNFYAVGSGTDDYTTESVLQTFGPIKSRHIDSLGGGLTGESFRVSINLRAGGAMERIYLTEPGGITDTNVLVCSRGYGRGMQGSTVFETVRSEMFVTAVTRAATTVITTDRPHGVAVGKFVTGSIIDSGSEAGVTPNLNGGFYVKGVDATNLQVYSSLTTPFSTAAGAGTYTVNNKMRLGLLLTHNPTPAGGTYSSSPTLDYSNFHSSAMLYAKYDVLKTDGSGNTTSAVLEVAAMPVEWDPDGLSAIASYPTMDRAFWDHNGGPYSPVIYTGIMQITRTYFNPVYAGVATYGLPGVWRVENEIRFLEPLEKVTSNLGLAKWKGIYLNTLEVPNIHFKRFAAAQRTFANRYIWRGASNTIVNVTGRNFKAAADASLGTWDELEHNVGIAGQAAGVVKSGPVHNGSPDPAELAAVVDTIATGGVIGVVQERTVAGTQFAHCSVLNGVESPYGRHSNFGYTIIAGTTFDVDGDGIEGLNLLGYFRDYSGCSATAGVVSSRIFNPSSNQDYYPTGSKVMNWGHMFWGSTAAELTTNYGGAGIGKLGLFFLGALDVMI